MGEWIMRNMRLGVGIASVAAATLFVPAFAGASPSASRVDPRQQAVSSATTAAAASAATRRPKCAYPPRPAVLSIGARISRDSTRVSFGGRLSRGKCGVQGAGIRLIKVHSGVVGSDTTDRNGSWGITVGRVTRTTSYYARSSNPRAQSGTVTIIIRKHH
jgi:hypothetical protein